MRINTAKRRMLEGKPALGIIAASGSTLAAQALSLAGFDFVLVDNQHGAWEQNAAMDAFHKISLGPATPMARVQQNDFYAIGRLLDRGALGIVVPMVNTREEAQAAAFAMHYPPLGGRSVGAFGVEFYGIADYGAWIEREGFLAVQIETKQAFENAEAILSVEGVDGCWIGPGDLAATMSLDLSNAGDRAKHEQAILRIRDICLQVGKIPGIYGHENPEYWIDHGFLFVTGVNDLALISQAGRSILSRFDR
ncbi:MAG: HpcH/HpaI aldolase family protein [Anaerolineae bacterium]